MMINRKNRNTSRKNYKRQHPKGAQRRSESTVSYRHRKGGFFDVGLCAAHYTALRNVCGQVLTLRKPYVMTARGRAAATWDMLCTPQFRPQNAVLPKRTDGRWTNSASVCPRDSRYVCDVRTGPEYIVPSPWPSELPLLDVSGPVSEVSPTAFSAGACISDFGKSPRCRILRSAISLSAAVIVPRTDFPELSTASNENLGIFNLGSSTPSDGPARVKPQVGELQAMNEAGTRLISNLGGRAISLMTHTKSNSRGIFP